jgi:cation:H+ antiporter
MEVISTLWTFPVIILAALLIAWAAECGQFYISQGLALAVLAWVQTLPEFAVEAAIALEAAKNPEQMHLITANFTGSLRLFVGFGWPMVYFVALFFSHEPAYQKNSGFRRIVMEDENSFTVLGLVPALLYFLVIYFKGTLNLWDGAILASIYGFYLWLLNRLPPQSAEGFEDLDFVPRWIMRQPKAQSVSWLLALFLAGALILWFAAHPFLNSMLALALALGWSQFVFVQWVAPFLSEFPEKLSAFNWARKVSKAPMALTNFVSSSVNQWTILVATVPYIYSFGVGRPAEIVFDSHQKVEILLTIVQSYLGFLFLASMDFSLFEATGLFILWLVQFFVPSIREEIIWVYGGWAAWESLRLSLHFRERNAFRIFSRMCRETIFRRVS